MTLLQMHGRNPEPSKSEKEQAPWAVRYYEARTMDRGQDEQQKTSQWTVKRLTQLLFPCEVAHGLACEDGARRCTHTHTIQEGALTQHKRLSLISWACFVLRSSISELSLPFSWSKVPLTSFCPLSGYILIA
jgi:hypothetical protein